MNLGQERFSGKQEEPRRVGEAGLQPCGGHWKLWRVLSREGACPDKYKVHSGCSMTNIPRGTSAWKLGNQVGPGKRLWCLN